MQSLGSHSWQHSPASFSDQLMTYFSLILSKCQQSTQHSPWKWHITTQFYDIFQVTHIFVQEWICFHFRLDLQSWFEFQPSHRTHNWCVAASCLLEKQETWSCSQIWKSTSKKASCFVTLAIWNESSLQFFFHLNTPATLSYKYSLMEKSHHLHGNHQKPGKESPVSVE